MGIIKKVYHFYYDDIKQINNPWVTEEKKNNQTNVLLLKYLSKPYSEFSEVNFHSDWDTITEKLNSIKSTLEKDDIGNTVKVSYAYFAKKELKLVNTVPSNKIAFNDIIELKDGKIVNSNEEGNIFVYDTDMNCIYILKGHLSGVRALCLLKDNKFASGSADKTIRIWDTISFKTTVILKEHSNAVISLSLLNDNKLASCSFREIIVYDHNYKPQYYWKEHINWVRQCIQIDRNRVVTTSDDYSVKIWDKHFRCLNTYKDHTDCVNAVCSWRDGRWVTGDKSGIIIVWARNMCYTRQLNQHKSAILCIKQIKDGRVVTGSSDLSIRVWDLDFRGWFIYKNHTSGVNQIYALKDGGMASVGNDGVMNIWR